jgi:hypothetical protein
LFFGKDCSRRLLLGSTEGMKRTARSLGGNFDINQQLPFSFYIFGFAN